MIFSYAFILHPDFSLRLCWNTGVENAILPLYNNGNYTIQKKEHLFTKSFSNLIFATFSPVEPDACGAACSYTITNLMTVLQELDSVALEFDDESKDDQLEEEDPKLEFRIRDPDGIDGISEGEPAAIDEGLSNSNGDMSESYYPGPYQDNTPFVLLNKNQIRGKMFAQTDGLFLKRVKILPKDAKRSKERSDSDKKHRASTRA